MVGDLGADLLVRVLCADFAGVLQNTRFNPLMVGSGSLLGRHGFAWANQPAASVNAGWAQRECRVFSLSSG